MNFHHWMILSLISGLVLTSCGNNSETMSSTIKALDNPLKECPDSPNCFRESFLFDESFDEVTDAAVYVLENLSTHKIEISTPDSLQRIDAIFKMSVFGYLDDLTLIIEENNDKTGTILYTKSASREGYYDLGVNKRRVKKIVRKMNKKLNSK